MRRRAFLLSGGISRQHDRPRYAGDVCAYYTLLVRSYGYREEDIRVCIGPGGSYPLLDGELYAVRSSRRESVHDALGWLDELGEGDSIFLMVTDHGSEEGVSLWGKGSFLSPADLASALGASLATKILVFGQCSAGSFGAACDGRSVALCAAGHGEPSFHEPRPAPGVEPRYNEFLYQLAGALGGSYPDGRPLCEDIAAPPRITVSEAFRYARDHDRWITGLHTCSEVPRIFDPSGLAKTLVL